MVINKIAVWRGWQLLLSFRTCCTLSCGIQMPTHFQLSFQSWFSLGIVTDYFFEMYQDRQDEFHEEKMLPFGQQPVMSTTQRLIGI